MRSLTQQVSPRRWTWLSYLLVSLLALVPRVAGLGAFVTSDEANFWIARSTTFLGAILTGDLAATAISVHPGVTTMWLGGVGAWGVRAARAWGLLEATPYAVRLAAMQLPIALVHTLGVVLGYALLRRMLPARVAFCAAVLWAADPFVVGYSRLLHVDALAGTFGTLALLAAGCFWHHAPQRRMLVLSGASAAAAALSKSPALAVAAVVALVALVALRRTRDVRPLLLWAAAALAAAALLWPALWAAPAQAIGQLTAGVTSEGALPHELGNFFLGRAYGDEAPGLAFYPVALALRTTPLSLLGLLLLPLALRAAPAASRRDLAMLAGFVVLFVLVMSGFPKKFNRYMVPVFPSLDILAACGIGGALGLWSPTVRRRASLAVSLLPALAAANLAAWHPYELDAFNQALGGAAAGAHAFQVGWGEGYEQAATWLNQQPDISGVVVAAARTETLQPYLRTGAQAFAPSGDYLPPNTGYVVVYIRDTQGGTLWPPFDRFYGRATPVYVVRIHGVEYAWIYQVPPQPQRPLAATFGPALQLRGFDLVDAARPGTTFDIRLYWSAERAPQTPYAIFIHLIGADGRRYAQSDPSIASDGWAANRYYTTLLALALPPSLPAGSYRLVIGLYDPASGQRLALDAPQVQERVDDGPGALELAQLVVR